MLSGADVYLTWNKSIQSSSFWTLIMNRHVNEVTIRNEVSLEPLKFYKREFA